MKNKIDQNNSSGFVFEKKGYMILLLGLVFIITGFVLMAGGGSEDPKEFNPAIFDFQRITLAPTLVMIGFAIEVFAIMRKPGK
jgi:hypothetical protein